MCDICEVKRPIDQAAALALVDNEAQLAEDQIEDHLTAAIVALEAALKVKDGELLLSRHDVKVIKAAIKDLNKISF